MPTVKHFIQRHPALSYFALTFAISWGGILVIVGPSGILGTKEEFERLFPIALPMIVLGPSVSGVLLTAVVAGRAGLRDFRSRLLKWRVNPRWYAAAILTAPLYFTAVLLAFSAYSREFLPGIVGVGDKVSFLLRGIVVALVAGIVEELGWTGFAVPTLRRRCSPVVTGLVVGAFWGLWHVLPKIWGSAAHDLVAYMPADLLSAVVGLTGYRILMVWVYERTESLFIAILMHMGLTASTLILQPVITGAPLMTVGLALVVAPWVIVAAVALVARRRRSGGGRFDTRREPPIASKMEYRIFRGGTVAPQSQQSTSSSSSSCSVIDSLAWLLAFADGDFGVARFDANRCKSPASQYPPAPGCCGMARASDTHSPKER